MYDGNSLDHTASQGYYRIVGEFDDHTAEYFTDDGDVAVAARNGLQKAGADVTITAWDDATRGYNLRWADEP